METIRRKLCVIDPRVIRSVRRMIMNYTRFLLGFQLGGILYLKNDYKRMCFCIVPQKNVLKCIPCLLHCVVYHTFFGF